ncbi:hypothetical protein CALVIDRAFT_594879 [Calocera viscosa TUFC12733]|uniref:Uncharacterized protein n=1 Tax=Calocera viscosa (strain TUFC12733) TaxID=1330018 RepID=A0A167R988_CALVF|nr:hypothetical protein CALVIDRAFT_594879 [Calocera viscosa TUFC12733]
MKNTQLPLPEDAPPGYETVTVPAGPGPSDFPSTPSGGARNEKRPFQAAALELVTNSPPPPEGSIWDLASASGWMDLWRRKQKVEEMRTTLRGLIYDTLRNLSDPGALSTLESCQAACRPHGISFEELIQEVVEGHTPLYWAILAVCHTHTPSSPSSSLPAGPSLSPSTSLPSSPTTQQGTGTGTEAAPGSAVGNSILKLLLSVPLTPSTVSDARAALMLNDANALFQTLRTYPTFAKTSYAESVIGLGAAAAAASSSSSSGGSPGTQGQGRISPVRVTHVSSPSAGAGTFLVSWSIPVFCKRVKVSRKISTQWIARGRAWQCSISVDGQGGPWMLSLKLLKGSASTPLDGVLRLGRPEGEKVELRLKKRKLEAGGHNVEVKLNSVPGGATLEYEDSPYLSPEGTLYVQGEFALEKNGLKQQD